ncbi:GCN5 family acetyltransferase [Desulfonema ishimotonii]|uniref:GCN5 family acetyltransferase n=1 Tax=Desulfonema ishimotonii TaxID=45657 RepID=A0A401FWZ2_9BACT|nr:bifunctional acetate--CoA ligase family protein/GNAT family N-acetyltransferase [Desulfonema ishimotonii]GBC61498.1 GCN5 family acetyltransferase [Desulfonema ishimotonii]
MTIRNIKTMFRPRSVALIGASQTPNTVGNVVARNLFSAGFEGNIFPVNPKYKTIEGRPVYPDIPGLPVVPDLGIVATPPDAVPGVIRALGEKGTPAAVVITAGFSEGHNRHGEALQQQMLDAARPFRLRIIGPNCLGIMVPGIFLNAGFSHIHALPGRIAFVAQSGAVITSVLDWATYRRIGFSHLVSLGDMADVDFGDMLDHLANDNRTRAILLYIETVTQARKFMSAARAAARMKPVIVVKAGRHAESARAAASHTGALAGSDAVYEAAFRRAGMLRVSDMQALFDAVGTLAASQTVSGDRLAILTNGGGMGVMATDTLIDKGGRLAKLSPETLSRLDQVLPPTWSHGNPADIIGDAPGTRYAAALDALLDDKNVDAVLVLNCPNAVASGTEAAQAVIELYNSKTRTHARPKTLLTSWLGEGAALGARQLFTENRIPTYETPAYAVRAFMQMVRYQHNQEMLIETPPNVPERFTPDTEAARSVITRAIDQGREWLTGEEAKAILTAYRIPVAEPRAARTPEEAGAIAETLGVPVALKILSPDIVHKSDVGGVVLGLESPGAVRETAADMLARVRAEHPDARIDGIMVEPMIRSENAHELIVGMTEDPQFGPVLLFGQGGTAVEVIRDKALALPPLNMHLAREVMERTQVYRLLKGYRQRSPACLESIALTLVKVSQLVCDIAEVAELDINPLLADEHRVIALDARIRVKPAAEDTSRRLAICPYPRELEESIRLPDGRSLYVRPIRPEDEPAFQNLFSSLSMEEIRLRFLHYMKILSHSLAARLTQIDYDRQMALVLTDSPEHAGENRLYGVVRISADPDNERAEFAILLHSDMTGMGLGPMLMRRIINYARKKGIREIYGDVLGDNSPMLKLARAFGFRVRPDPDDPGVMLITLKL